MTKVTALVCPVCKDTIYSRAHHDYHDCSCGAISVDGGRSYLKYSWNTDLHRDSIQIIELEIDATEKELYEDWNFRKEKFGRIKA